MFYPYFKEGVTEVSALKVWQDSCQYLYLPRLLNSEVFVQAVTAGCATRDGFGFAAGKEGDRWLGFAFGQPAIVTIDADTLLISHAAATEYQHKLEAEQRERAALQAEPAANMATSVGSGGGATHGASASSQRPMAAKSAATSAATAAVALPNRFFGLVDLDATTATMDFSTIVNEVIQHFAAQSGVDVTVTVEIEARTRDGFEAGLQRTIKENCGVLKFRSADFEQD